MACTIRAINCDRIMIKGAQGLTRRTNVVCRARCLFTRTFSTDWRDTCIGSLENGNKSL
jgi:hypothetical protein